MPNWRRHAIKDSIQRGMKIRFSRTFHEKEIGEFAFLTRDYNPCHFSKRYCEAKGFEGPILHGLLVASMICEPGGQWGWLASEMNFKYVKPVYAGDTITCEMIVTEFQEDRRFARATARYANQREECVLTADLAGYLPSSKERLIMAEMVDAGDPTNPLLDE